MNPWRVPRRVEPLASIQLTSLLDVLTIIVVFLLPFQAPGEDPPRLAADLALPVSTALAAAPEAVTVRITPAALWVDGERVLDLEPGPLGPTVPALAREGRAVRPLRERLEPLAGGPRGPRLVLECDQDLSYALLADVMHTAGASGFREFHFLVLGGPSGPSAGAPR